MADVIQLLPDSIANQIAAGEVIQRPASVVKELLENAVDAGSRNIKLIVKESGKVLVQVIDDGCGMSETDARMSFERHATSKIRMARDIFALRTMGFRGEALASIASVAQVEMRTRQAKNELGTLIINEGSIIKTQEACQCAVGTNICVKNLFYNIPARRNFLKSNTVEMRHINDEFTRVALANPNIFFSLTHNGSEVYHLPPSNLRQRITNILGAASNKKLVPVNEDTDLVKISGYVSKPEYAKKTRGEQFFFVNNRFIKSGWLHHALVGAYDNLIVKDTYPLYVIFIDIDPARIDINVHPTKQEIKFDDDKMVYNYLKVAVRHALGQYSVTPTLDFDQSPLFESIPNRATDKSKLHFVPNEANTDSSAGSYSSNERYPISNQRQKAKDWEKLYEGLDVFSNDERTASDGPDNADAFTLSSKISEDPDTLDDSNQTFTKEEKTPFQVHNQFIISQIKSGLIIIDQQAAHERILYEYYLKKLEENTPSIQKKLFPQTIHLPSSDAQILASFLPQIKCLGFDIEVFGGNSFLIHGVPTVLKNDEREQDIIEQLLVQYKENLDLKLDYLENLAQSMAKSTAIKKGKKLEVPEMQKLIDELFACEMPFSSPRGRKCLITYELGELNQMFEL